MSVLCFSRNWDDNASLELPFQLTFQYSYAHSMANTLRDKHVYRCNDVISHSPRNDLCC